jgi:hypothetical protein
LIGRRDLFFALCLEQLFFPFFVSHLILGMANTETNGNDCC